MGNVPERDEKRDQKLIADYIEHNSNKFAFSTSQLVGKYKISLTRIYQILDFYKVPRRTKRKS